MLAAAVPPLALAAETLPAQRKQDEAWREDPYTKNKPAAMKRAGILNYGPFMLEEDHGTDAVHKKFPEAKFLWLETEHFRIGSSLKSQAIPTGSDAKRRIQAELKLLKKRLPRVKPKTKVLDRWLRIHLFAMRLEQVHADFLKQIIQRRSQEFPSLDKVSADEKDPRYMGRGPHLGMPQKPILLLFAKESNLMRYAKLASIQVDERNPHPIFKLTRSGSLLFGTSAEIITHQVTPELRLHAHVLFNTVQSLIQGYKYFSHQVPAWISEGLGNVFVRRLHEEEYEFSGMKDWDTSKNYPRKWRENVRNLMGSGYAPKLETFVKRMQSKELDFNMQMCAWSLCDFLCQYKKGRPLALFLDVIKRTPEHEPGKMPSTEAILALQEQARKEAFGMEWSELEAAWHKWARRAYKD